MNKDIGNCEPTVHQFWKDRKLHFSRRIDWRFLLPNPQLSRVGYIGKNRDHLIESLQLFSNSLTIISSLRDRPADVRGSHFDVVVLQTQSMEYLKIVNALLVPGGCFYWEINRMEILRSLIGLGKKRLSLNAYKKIVKSYWWLIRYCHLIAYLYRLGFRDVEVHWHRPNFNQCLEIIPLRNEAALRHIFSRVRAGSVKRWKLSIGRFLINMRLLAYFVPCVSIVASKVEQH